MRVTSEEGAFGADPPAPDDDLFERPLAEVHGEDLPKAFRAKQATVQRTREAAVQGVVWAGVGAVTALMLMVAIVFRVDVVRLWPRTASAYASIGLPVNRVGLTIENVHAQPSLLDGRPSLVVSGVLRNIRARPVTAPPLSIVLLDKDGKRVAVKHAAATDTAVPPGQTRNFAISLVDPPIGASDLEVTFLVSGLVSGSPVPHAKPVSAPKITAAAPDARAMLLGPSIEEVRPIASSSPYALSSSAAVAR